MGENSGIAWTDHTCNFWEGCTKVGPGCDACYAAARDVRYHAGSHWGAGAPRRQMSEHTRNIHMHGRMDGYGSPGLPPELAATNRINAYLDLWKRINGPEEHMLNPWVVATTFRVVKANIDAAEARAA